MLWPVHTRSVPPFLERNESSLSHKALYVHRCVEQVRGVGFPINSDCNCNYYTLCFSICRAQNCLALLCRERVFRHSRLETREVALQHLVHRGGDMGLPQFQKETKNRTSKMYIHIHIYMYIYIILYMRNPLPAANV